MINILLLEDDITLAMGFEYALKSEGFNVEFAKSVKEAESKLSNTQYNLALFDVMLPDGSGYDVCKSLREDKLSSTEINNSDIPIIFLTACDEEANVVLGLDLGGDDYITKPVRIRELISRINAVLRRKNTHILNTAESNKEKVIFCDELKLYPLSYKVLKNGIEIILTSVEYKLLLTFINNSKKVLSRATLLENLWDINGDFVDDNTLSVYIKRLREKIEDNPRQPSYIVTLRGLGYKWNKDVRGDL